MVERSGAVVSLSGVLANASLVLVLAAVYALGWGAIRRGRARRVACARKQRAIE